METKVLDIPPSVTGGEGREDLSFAREASLNSPSGVSRAAVGAGFLFTGLAALAGCGKPAPVPTPEEVSSSAAIRVEEHADNVYVLDHREWPKNLSSFLDLHHNLRVVTITGHGNGGYGRDSEYLVITRDAKVGEPEQSVLLFDDYRWPESLAAYLKEHPKSEVVAATGNGNGGYGRDSGYTVVIQPRAE